MLSSLALSLVVVGIAAKQRTQTKRSTLTLAFYLPYACCLVWQNRWLLLAWLTNITQTYNRYIYYMHVVWSGESTGINTSSCPLRWESYDPLIVKRQPWPHLSRMFFFLSQIKPKINPNTSWLIIFGYSIAAHNFLRLVIYRCRIAANNLWGLIIIFYRYIVAVRNLWGLTIIFYRFRTGAQNLRGFIIIIYRYSIGALKICWFGGS